jgi:hypothetical protein
MGLIIAVYRVRDRAVQLETIASKKRIATFSSLNESGTDV